MKSGRKINSYLPESQFGTFIVDFERINDVTLFSMNNFSKNFFFRMSTQEWSYDFQTTLSYSFRSHRNENITEQKYLDEKIQKVRDLFAKFFLFSLCNKNIRKMMKSWKSNCQFWIFQNFDIYEKNRAWRVIQNVHYISFNHNRLNNSLK